MKKVVLISILALVFCVPVAKAEFHAPPAGYWQNCGYGIWGWHGASHYASCPFSLNIGRGVRYSSEYGAYRLIGTSYSPVTHKTYRVNCIRHTYGYRCTAGISAVIWVSF